MPIITPVRRGVLDLARSLLRTVNDHDRLASFGSDDHLFDRSLLGDRCLGDNRLLDFGRGFGWGLRIGKVGRQEASCKQAARSNHKFGTHGLDILSSL